MSARAEQVRFAARAWAYALTLCTHALPAGPEREALIACRAHPTLPHIRAVLAIGQHHPWLPLIQSALLEIGIAAIEDILKEADHDHRR